MKYLYIFNYPPEKEELCKLEFKYLFKDTFKSKYYFTDTDIDINTSIFIKANIDIYYFANNFRELLEDVIVSNLNYEDFKIIYYKNDTYHIDYQDSLNKCRSLSYGVGGSVSLKNPKHTLAYTRINDTWVFGYYHHGVPTWKKHDDKPRTFSNSLDIQLARTLVNIAFENNHDLKGIDPCCGMGTVVLEALGLGYNMCGYDVSREISYSARVNLQHYGYDSNLINRQSIHDNKFHYDVGILDIPYNLYTPITYQEQFKIIESARRIIDKLVIVTYDQMDDDLIKAGFKIVDKCRVQKSHYDTFSRFVYVCL